MSRGNILNAAAGFLVGVLVGGSLLASGGAAGVGPAPAKPPAGFVATPAPAPARAPAVAPVPAAEPVPAPVAKASREPFRPVPRPETPAVNRGLYGDVPDPDLLAEARDRWRAGDPRGAIDRLQVLLDRPLATTMRVRGLSELGFACRRLGDRAAEERALREAVRLDGGTTWWGVFAVHHLAETMHLEGKEREALAITDRLLGRSDLGDWLAGSVAWQRGRIAQTMGDPALAEEELRRLLRDYPEREDLAGARADAKRRLALLAAPAGG